MCRNTINHSTTTTSFFLFDAKCQFSAGYFPALDTPGLILAQPVTVGPSQVSQQIISQVKSSQVKSSQFKAVPSQVKSSGGATGTRPRVLIPQWGNKQATQPHGNHPSDWSGTVTHHLDEWKDRIFPYLVKLLLDLFWKVLSN